MLEVCKNQKVFRTQELKQPANIIVTKHEEQTTYENGARITKRIPKKVDVTALVNETKKLIKTMTAEEKIAEVEKIFTK